MADIEERSVIDRREDYKKNNGGVTLPNTKDISGYYKGKKVEYPNPCHPENKDVEIKMVPKLVDGQIQFFEATTIYTGQHYFEKKYCSTSEVMFKNNGRNDLDWK